MFLSFLEYVRQGAGVKKVAGALTTPATGWAGIEISPKRDSELLGKHHLIEGRTMLPQG